MNRLRLTIAQLMAIVLCFGFGFAALRNANAFWAGATFCFAIISVSVASVGAFARKGNGRVFWAGFAIAAGIRLIISIFTPQAAGSLNGPPRPLLYQLQSYINPSASGGSALIAYVQICNSLEVILLGLIGAVLAQFIAAQDDRPNL